MVVRIGSEESSSILWVHTGGNDCRCRGHKWGRGQGRDMLTLRIQGDYNSHRAVKQQASGLRSYRLPTCSICKGSPLFLFLIFYLFTFREEGREKQSEGNIDM